MPTDLRPPQPEPDPSQADLRSRVIAAKRKEEEKGLRLARELAARAALHLYRSFGARRVLLFGAVPSLCERVRREGQPI